MKMQPTSPTVGVEITGVDLKTMTDGEFEAIGEAFAEHGVIFFRDQELTPQDHLDVARRWGDINVNRFFTPVEGFPEIAEVRKEPDQAANIGGAWHTDHSYDDVPAMGSMLLAREVPPVGGDTLFASQHAAFKGLSTAMQDTLLGLWADHSSRHIFGAGGSGQFSNEQDATQDTMHPVVIEHPLSGRPTLYVNLAFTRRIHGWTDRESEPLLQWLYQHAARPEFTTRFEWAPGSVALWDNRAVQHNAVNDYHGHRRLMHRITIEGTKIEPARPQSRPL